MDAIKHPADIIAEAIRSFSRTEGAGRVGEIAISQLEAAGYTIVHDSENHGPTRDRAAGLADGHGHIKSGTITIGDEWRMMIGPEVAAAIRAMGEKK